MTGKSTNFSGCKLNYVSVCPVKCTDIYRIISALIRPVRYVIDYRQSVSLRCAECTHMVQPAQHLQCRMPNTIATEHVLNTQCTMCSPPLASLSTPALTVTAVSNYDASHSVLVFRPSERHTQSATIHLHCTQLTCQHFPSNNCLVQCLVKLAIVNLMFMSLLLQL